MANKDALAQLRDIHLPTPIRWWPLAPGWYVASFLACVVLFWVAFLWYRRHRNGRAKRQALHLLARFEREYEAHADSEKSASLVSALLKRVALVYFPRTQVASLQGEEWLAFLNNSSKGLDFNSIRAELLEIPYQPKKDCDLLLLFEMARAWIKQRRKPCLN